VIKVRPEVKHGLIPQRGRNRARVAFRYIGFTGHKDPLVHLRMLEIVANHKFRFDAVQMPLNLMDACERPFIVA
jgi:hypothetical protein